MYVLCCEFLTDNNTYCTFRFTPARYDLTDEEVRDFMDTLITHGTLRCEQNSHLVARVKAWLENDETKYYNI